MSAKVILLVGAPKTGKTVSACTFPKPLAFFEWDDDGILSVLNAKDTNGNHIIPLDEQKQIDRIAFNKERTYNLTFQTVQKGKIAPPHASEAPALLSKYNMGINAIGKGESILFPGEKKVYRTVVIDPLTVFFQVWKEAILFINSQPTLQIQDYGTMEAILFSQFIPSLKALPVDYVILVDHTDMEKDELSGMVSEFPIGPSKNMGKRLSQAFTEVWIQKEEAGKFVWRTRSAGLFQGGGSRHHLPNPIEAKYSIVKPYFDSAIESFNIITTTGSLTGNALNALPKP